MVATFILHDRLTVPAPLAARHNLLPNQSILVLNSNCSEEHQLIRLLLGTVEVECLIDSAKWTQSTNYSVLGAPLTAIRAHSGLSQLLAVHSISTAELDKLLRATLKQRSYYGRLLAEIEHYFWRTHTKEHTLAFLHLYRFLEHVSFAFPLLYSARTNDFAGAHAALRDFFSGDKGELGFFKKFVQASIDSTLLDQSSTIDFSPVASAYRGSAFNALKRLIDTNDIDSETANLDLSVKHRALLGLCIDLRNRYFHFSATNPNNISANELGDSNIFFGCFNQLLLNWLAVLYFETLKHRINSV